MIPPLRPGILVRTKAVFPYPLPRGLSSGMEVTVEEVDSAFCAVRDRAGRRWSVPVVALDTGRMVWESGSWVPEKAA